jgi:hypothetical protein
MRTIVAATSVAGLLVAGCGGAAQATTTHRLATSGTGGRFNGQVTSLAGHRWHYRAQVDGVGDSDRITVVGGKDLRLTDLGGSGHVTVRVHLAGTVRTVSRRLRLSYYYSPRKRWTPWYGAAQLDHRSGRELLLGSTTGAHTQVFTVLTYRDGALRNLPAPAGLPHAPVAQWSVNSSAGTGSEGWRCTNTGVESRAVYPGSVHRHRFHIVRNKYVFGSAGWTRTHHYAATVTSRYPPKSTDGYAEFACRGLPPAF